MYELHPSERMDPDSGWERCLMCGEEYPGGDRAYMKPVVDITGETHQDYWATDMSDGPFFHPECWRRLTPLLAVMENHTLLEFAHD